MVQETNYNPSKGFLCKFAQYIVNSVRRLVMDKTHQHLSSLNIVININLSVSFVSSTKFKRKLISIPTLFSLSAEQIKIFGEYPQQCLWPHQGHKSKALAFLSAL